MKHTHTPRRPNPSRSGCQDKMIPKLFRYFGSRGILRLPISVRRGSRCATVQRTKWSRWRLHCLIRRRHSWVCGLGSRRARRGSCAHDNSRREAGTGLVQAVRDQQLHQTRRCSSCHSVRCASHSSRVNKMSDYTKRVSSLNFARSSWGSSVQCRRKDGLSVGSVGDQDLHGERFVGLGTPPMRTTANVGVRTDGRTTCVAGRSRERDDKSRMDRRGNIGEACFARGATSPASSSTVNHKSRSIWLESQTHLSGDKQNAQSECGK